MATLEKVYLANVVIYLKSFEDAYRFTLINKKSKDALEILRITPGFAERAAQDKSQRYGDNTIYYAEMLRKEAKLFPNLETLVLSHSNDSFIGFFNYIKHYPRLILNFNHYVSMEELVNESILNSIVEISIIYFQELRLNVFKKLERVKLLTRGSTQPILKVFDKNQHLSYVKLYCCVSLDDEFIDNFHEYPIRNKVIITLDRHDYERIKTRNIKLFRSAIICSRSFDVMNETYPVIDKYHRYFVQDCNVVEKSNNFKSFYPKSLFFQDLQNPTRKMDLTNLTFLQSLTVPSLQFYNPPTSLTHFKLRKLGNFNDEYLQLNTILTGLQELQKLEIEGMDISFVFPPKLNTLVLSYSSCTSQNVSQLKKLVVLDSSSVDLTQCVGLTALEFIQNKMTQSLSMLTNLQSLTCFVTSNELKEKEFLPHSLTSLQTTPMLLEKLQIHKYTTIRNLYIMNIQNNIDLSKCTFLDSLTIAFCWGHSVVYPTKINHLTINSVKHCKVDLHKIKVIESLTISSSRQSTILLPPTFPNLALLNSDVVIPNFASKNITSMALISSTQKIDELPDTLQYLYLIKNDAQQEIIPSLFPQLKNFSSN